MKYILLTCLLMAMATKFYGQDSLSYFEDKKEHVCDAKAAAYEIKVLRKSPGDSIVYYKSVFIKTKKPFEEGTYKCVAKLQDLHDFKTLKTNRQALRQGGFICWYENGNMRYQGAYKEGIVDEAIPFTEWTEAGEKIYLLVDQLPVFPNGNEGLKKFIQTHVVYPPEARKNNIQEKIYVKFTINKKGKVKNISTIKGQNQILIDAAIKVIKKMPKWKPGEKDGKKVNVWFVLPINYKITA